MPDLTLQQIDALVAQARTLGMTAYEADGFREALLMRTAQPELGAKLDMSLKQLPLNQTASIDEFLSAIDAHGAEIQARGAAYLNNLSDDEWNALFTEGENA